jgi:hypothetical protein
MSINLNSRIVAETRFQSVDGTHAAGAYCLQLTLGLQVQNWPEQEGPVPVVRFGDAQVVLDGGPGLLLGYAHPEIAVPFRVFKHAHTRAVLYSILLAPQALEAIEKGRAGGGVGLQLKVQAEISVGTNVDAVFDDVRCHIAQSDWLRVLEEVGYGRTLLFEVPVPRSLGAEGNSVMASLAAAKRAFIEGRYGESVAACRSVLEGLTQCLGQGDDMRKVRDAVGQGRRELTVLERELRLRSVALEYAHLAHHPSEMQPDCVYDRSAAQMMLGVAVSLASAAFGRVASSRRGD